MPFCENLKCENRGGQYAREDLRLGPNQEILCIPCAALSPEQVETVGKRMLPPVPQPRWGYELNLNERDGLRAAVRFEDVTLEVRATPDAMRKVLRAG